MRTGAVGSRELRYNQILVWMRSFAKFIKFLQTGGENEFVPGMLNINFIYEIRNFPIRFLKFLLIIQPPLSIALV